MKLAISSQPLLSLSTCPPDVLRLLHLSQTPDHLRIGKNMPPNACQDRDKVPLIDMKFGGIIDLILKNIFKIYTTFKGCGIHMISSQMTYN